MAVHSFPDSSRGSAQSMDFSYALAELKAGCRVQRVGWICVGQAVVLRRGYPDGIVVNDDTAKAFGIEQDSLCVFQPYFLLQAGDGSFVPWTPTVSDLLADDWMLSA